MTPKARVRHTGMTSSRKISQQVGQRGRVLERVRGVGVEDAAAVRAQLLDRLLRGGRGQRDRRRAAVDAGDVDAAWRLIVTPSATSTIATTKDSGSRTRVIPRTRSTQKLPIRSVAGAGEAAHQRHRDRHADRGGDEVLHGQPGHLDEVAHDRLRHVRLPVRVGHERDRGVERDPRVDGAAAEAQRQQRLQPLEQVEQHDGQEREGQQRGRVAGPALVGVRVDPDDAVHRALDPPVRAVGVDPGHVVAERHVGRGEEQEQEPQLEEPGQSWTTSELLRPDEGDEQVDDQREGGQTADDVLQRSQALQPPQRQRQQREAADDHQHVGHVGHPRNLLRHGHGGRAVTRMRSPAPLRRESSRLPNALCARSSRGLTRPGHGVRRPLGRRQECRQGARCAPTADDRVMISGRPLALTAAVLAPVVAGALLSTVRGPDHEQQRGARARPGGGRGRGDGPPRRRAGRRRW